MRGSNRVRYVFLLEVYDAVLFWGTNYQYLEFECLAPKTALQFRKTSWNLSGLSPKRNSCFIWNSSVSSPKRDCSWGLDCTLVLRKNHSKFQVVCPQNGTAVLEGLNTQIPSRLPPKRDSSRALVGLLSRWGTNYLQFEWFVPKTRLQF